MLGIRFMKAPPTTYVLHHKHGRVKQQGPGLSFFYYAPTSTLVAVPLGSCDVPFAFTEASVSFAASARIRRSTERAREMVDLISPLPSQCGHFK